MNLHKKKNESQQLINSVGIQFPIDLLHKNNNKYSKLNTNIKSNNSIKINRNSNINKNNTTTNNKNCLYNKNKILNGNRNYIHSNFSINNSYILNNNSKIKNKKKNNSNVSNLSNIRNINNNSISHHYNHKTNQSNKNKTSNPINTYIINTLNLNGKDYAHSGIVSAKSLKSNPKSNKEYESEINKLIKEKEESQNMVKKQKKLIEKLIEDNQKLEYRIKDIIYENQKINKKIGIHQENQEQLIMLVKIVQKSGVDVEELIDKWNNDVEMEINNNNITNDSNIFSNNNNEESYTDSTYDLNGKIDPSSFIPINIEEPHINKKVFKGVPKLNLDIIKNNLENNRPKFINNSK